MADKPSRKKKAAGKKKRVDRSLKTTPELKNEPEDIPPGMRQIAMFYLAFSVVSRAIPWIAICICIYFLSGAISSMAGKTTVSNLSWRWVVGISKDDKPEDIWPPVALLGGVGAIIAVAIGRYRLTKSKNVYLAKRVATLEKAVNPDRTSSGLLPSGETNPEHDL